MADIQERLKKLGAQSARSGMFNSWQKCCPNFEF